MSFGERIKQRRADLALRREELAVKTGISYSQMARYETDENQATAEAILAIAQALGVSTDWLLGNSKDLEAADLSEPEKEAVILLRGQSPKKQAALVEVLKTIANL